MHNTANDSDVLDRPVRLDRRFWILLAVLTPMTLYISTPWKWGLPWFAVVAGCVGLPFIVALPAYAVLLFTSGVLRGTVPAHKLWAFVSVVAYIGAGCALITYVKSSAALADVGMFLLSSTAVVLYGVLTAKSRSPTPPER